MKNLFVVASLLISSSVFAETTRLKCEVETSQTGDVVSETVYLENGYIYAPVFNGDIAAGSGAVESSRLTGDDLVFEKVNEEDLTLVSLTKIGSTLSIGLWKYVERISLDGTAGSLRSGFCTSQKID